MQQRVAIVTSMPRAERVHVYNEMARLQEIQFRVFYLRPMAYGRQWSRDELPSIEHDALFIPEIRLYKHLYFSPGLLSQYLTYDPTLMIMTQYASPGMQEIMWLESIRHKPWVFWSEPPYTRYNDDPIIPFEKLGQLLRKFALLPLSRWPLEVWATGTRAVAMYEEIVNDGISVRNLPYYADLDRFFEANQRRCQASHLRFLFCGSLSRRKAADVVAEAVQRLANQNLNFEVVIVGDGPLRSTFEGLSASVKQHVRLLGFLPLSQIPDVYAATDVLLFPSRHDGWGMTLMEGMAAGQPVISTAQTGSAVDLICEGKNGFLLPGSTVDHLEEAMRWFIEHTSSVHMMGNAAQETARRYTHRVGARHFLDMIQSVLHSSTSKGRLN